MKRLAPVLVLVAGFALTACSSDKESAATSSTQAATTATTTPGATHRGEPESRFCQIGADFSQRFGKLAASLQGTAESLRADLSSLKGVVDEARTAAPAPIKSDVDTLAQAFDQLYSQAESANFDPRTTAAAMAKLATSGVRTAGTHLQEYGAQVCGIGTPSSTP